MVDAEHDDATKQAWQGCETKALTWEDFERQHAGYLVNLACESRFGQMHQMHIAYGIYSYWIEENEQGLVTSVWPQRGLSDSHKRAVIRGLLDESCPGAKDMGEYLLERLRNAVAN